jgi:hypothetical protein
VNGWKNDSDQLSDHVLARWSLLIADRLAEFPCCEIRVGLLEILLTLKSADFSISQSHSIDIKGW